MQPVTGYQHPDYARSLAEFGRPRPLTNSGGWIIERQIGATEHHDAMGCYPIFTCRDWQQLGADLHELNDHLVSLAIVADPFGHHNLASLTGCFDLVIPFKEHWAVDLHSLTQPIATKHHRYYARKALQSLDVSVCDQPSSMLTEWERLYTHLIERHNLQGIKKFSHSAFQLQLQIPGLVMIVAKPRGDGGSVAGIHLWYTQENVAHSHLAAYSPEGYTLMGSYALYWFAIEYFRGKVHWLNLGAGAGLQKNANDGLSQFKRGWSNCSRTAYFCGKIFDQKRYDALTQASQAASPVQYFPAYRQGEIV